MRKLLVEYLAMNYDSKMFGTTFRHLRAVNVLMPLFCLAGLYNILTSGFDVWQIVSFLPFVCVFLIWFLYFKANPIDLSEMDWEQECQYLSINANSQWDFEQLEIVKNKFINKYRGKEKFVETGRFLFPWIVITVTLVIYAIFGFNEAGFEPSRFF